MKTTMILGMLSIALFATVLVPTGSALTCTSYVTGLDAPGAAHCELRNAWVSCNGNYYRGDYVLDHPEVLLNCA